MINRKSKQREAILRLLKRANSHPTAAQIYEQVREEIPKISKGTVYRNLGVLRKIGLILELNLNGTNVSRYDAIRENHYHFRCEKCGRVFDIDEPVDKDLDRRVTLKTGLKISHHELEFHGLCRDCQ